MVGLHYTEGYSYLNSFYFTAMLATGEGPNTAPVTAAGKIFVGVMAFVSVGTVVGALLFIFGPLFSQLAKEGVEIVEEVEERRKKENL
jgi:H+/gluconate symporter-like permease